MRRDENNQPPRWADYLLEWFCAPHLVDEIQGDLHELYIKWVKQHGVRKARWRYIFHAIKFLRPFAMKRKRKVYSVNHTAMFNNFITISLRHLWRYKGFSIINVFGLTIGTVCCLYAILYVNEQSGYDVHHRDANKIYRVTSEVTEPAGTPFHIATTSPPIAETLRQDYPDVVVATRLFKDIGVDQFLFKEGTNSFYESKGYYADPSFFQVFNYTFLEGSGQHALTDPYTVVLSKKIAQKLFGDKKAVDRTITINGVLFKVTGVFDDALNKSHIRAHFLMSFRNSGMVEFIRTSNEWVGQNMVYTYLLLSPQGDPAVLENKLPAFVERHAKEQLNRMTVRLKKALHLQPVTSIHTSSQLDSELDKNANPRFIQMVLIVAGLIQLMACINFMNLTTARFTNRAKEIGIRKAIGASKRSIIARFLGESFLLSAFSVSVAIPVVWYTIPYFNELVGAGLGVSFLYRPETYLFIMGLIIGTGFLAGSYPAFYLSAFKAAAALKGNALHHTSSFPMRKGLVVTQFVVSVTLVMAIVIISQQLSYLQKKELGFDSQQKIVFPFRAAEAKRHQAVFAEKINLMSQITQTGGAAYYPSHWLGETIPIFYQGEKERKGTGVWINRVDENFIQALQISLLSGRNFLPSDSGQQVIVNETALKELAIPLENAIGAPLSFEYRETQQSFTIVGVVKDFNFRSLKDPMRPLMLVKAKPDQINYLIADVNTQELPDLLAQCERVWKKNIPDVPFEYSFLEDDLRQQYEADNVLLVIINTLAFVAISIACLGLFSLAAFTAEQRTKEVSIRKVMGAGIGDIIKLLTSDFVILVTIAIVISVPIAWYAMDRWLHDFSYRIDMEWWMFALAGIMALLVAVLTVCFQTMKAALVNPADSLRND